MWKPFTARSDAVSFVRKFQPEELGKQGTWRSKSSTIDDGKKPTGLLVSKGNMTWQIRE
jgi:hypothetical protein